MTNREKYRFEDFTLNNYKRLLQIAVDNGFQFILHKDDFVEDRRDVIWRHDVEFEPELSLRMAEIEHDIGVKATYFFQLHSEYYNTFDSFYRDIFNKIKDLGHHVGMHFDSHYWNITDEKQLDEYIKLDRNYFEMNMGVEIDTFSFHNTTPFTQSCLALKYGGLINVYSSFFKNHFDYCSDSLGYWRYDRLEDVLNNNAVRHLQVLTHDGNWSDEVLSPRKRLVKFMSHHSERLINKQIDGLHSAGMLCPDDNED